MNHTPLWWFGQVVAIVAAIAMRLDGYSFATTLAIYAIIALLIDIRENTVIALLIDIRENTEHKKGGDT